MAAKVGSEAWKAQEEIVTRELIADGETRGDDKRWLMAHRSFLDLLQAKRDEHAQKLTPEQITQCAERDRVETSKFELTCAAAKLDMQRTVLQAEANERQVRDYEQVSKDIDRQMEDARRQIVECKAELSAAKMERRHRQEYDLMAKMIEKHPARADLRAKMDIVEQEIAHIEGQRRALLDKIDVAKKRFYALGVLLKNMQLDYQDEEAKFEDVDSAITMESLQPASTNAKPAKAAQILKSASTPKLVPNGSAFGPKPPPTIVTPAKEEGMDIS